VISASMELSAESRVVLDLAKIVFRLCGRGSRVSRKTVCWVHLLATVLGAEGFVGGLVVRRCRLRWVIRRLLVDGWWGGCECVEGLRNPKARNQLVFSSALDKREP
jgi:hypothetical protein